jgi:hypothetical protein
MEGRGFKEPQPNESAPPVESLWRKFAACHLRNLQSCATAGAQDTDRDLATVRRAAMFEKEDALPGAELHSPASYRDHFTRAGQDGTNVRGAVVGTFRGMFEIRSVLGHEALEKFLEIAACGWIGVFHNDQTATRVPNEKREGPGLHPALRDNCGDAVCNFVGAFPVRRNGEAGGVNWHSGEASLACRRSATEPSKIRLNHPGVRILA